MSRFLQLVKSPRIKFQEQLMSRIYWGFKNVDVKNGREIVTMLHARAVVLGLEKDDVTVGKLMGLYSRMAKDYSTTCLLFDRLPRKELGAWNAMLFAHADFEPVKAITAFAELEKTEIMPKHYTFRALLTAHARCNSPIGAAYGVLKKMTVEYDLEPDVSHFGCIIDKLVRLEYIEQAISEVYRLKFGVTDHICGMIFGRCAKLDPADIYSAKKMLDILVQVGGVYKVAFPVYMTLQRAGLKWPNCVIREAWRGPGKSFL